MSEQDFSLEEALQELEQIVQQMESGELNLDAAVDLFERGQTLIKRCQKDLDSKELRIRQITESGELE